MKDLKTEIISLLKNWKDEVSKEIETGRLFLFGSLINYGGRQFNPLKSDVDLIIEFPKNLTNAIEIKNWLIILKRHKQSLEQKLTFLIKKETNNQEIVSLIPISEIELKFHLHKSGARNFFEINEFYNIENDTVEKGEDLFKFEHIENELIIQAIELSQKVRNDFLKNCAILDFKKLEWLEDDRAIPKDLARHSAKIKSLEDGEIFNADSLNTSLGLDFLKNITSSFRNIHEIYNLYCWIDSRTNGSSDFSNTSKVLSQEEHLLLYELLFQKILEVIPKIKTESKTESKTEFAESHKEFLSNTGLLEKLHNHKNALLLEDIFISPNLSYFDDIKNEKKEIKYSEIIDEFISNSKIVFTGKNQSGKTTICKKIITDLFNFGFIPVLLVEQNDNYLGNIQNKIAKAFEKQYNSNINFDDIDKKQIVIIIDDFHKAKHKAKILASLTDFENQILIIDDVFGLRYKEEKLISSFNTFEICELTPSQRYELIENWVLLSDTT